MNILAVFFVPGIFSQIRSDVQGCHSFADGKFGEFGDAGDIQLFHDFAPVGLDGLDAEVEAVGGLFGIEKGDSANSNDIFC